MDVDEATPKAKHLAKPENRATLVDPTVVAVVRVRLFTGARRSELRELEWNHVDFAGARRRCRIGRAAREGLVRGDRR